MAESCRRILIWIYKMTKFYFSSKNKISRSWSHHQPWEPLALKLGWEGGCSRMPALHSRRSSFYPIFPLWHHFWTERERGSAQSEIKGRQYKKRWLAAGNTQTERNTTKYRQGQRWHRRHHRIANKIESMHSGTYLNHYTLSAVPFTNFSLHSTSNNEKYAVACQYTESRKQMPPRSSVTSIKEYNTMQYDMMTPCTGDHSHEDWCFTAASLSLQQIAEELHCTQK